MSTRFYDSDRFYDSQRHYDGQRYTDHDAPWGPDDFASDRARRASSGGSSTLYSDAATGPF